MKITRRFTEAGKSPYAAIPFRRATSEIRNPDGSVVFRLEGFEVPEHWSQVAVDILAQKYFRKAGVPQPLKRVEENGVPAWLWRSGRRARARRAARQGAHRRRDRLPAGLPPPRRLLDLLGLEGRLLLDRGRRPRVLRRESATCSPRRWPRRTARSGSTPACTGPTASKARRQGHYFVDSATGKLDALDVRLRASRSRTPASSSRVSDDLVNEGGIMDLWVREARIFKYGSGTGSNFSTLRGEGEPLSGGGKSSGLMSFLKIGDRAAGAIKSRRHHPPRRQDGRARSRSPGHRRVHQLEGDRRAEGRGPRHRLEVCQKHLKAIMNAVHQLRSMTRAERATTSAASTRRRTRRLQARHPRRPSATWSRRTTSPACSSSPSRASRSIDFEEYDTDWNSKAYYTVSGQNSNNSVRITERVHEGRRRTTAPGTSTGDGNSKRSRDRSRRR